MQIIVVDKRLAKAQTLALTPRTALAAFAAFAMCVSFGVYGLHVATFKLAADLRIPLIHDYAAGALREELASDEQFVRENVTSMARKLGEMQAQLMRLDALGERVSRLAGIRPEEFNFKELPGRGGVATESRAQSLEELKNEIDRIALGVEHRVDYLDVIESELITTQVRRSLLPGNTPMPAGFVGSGYGMRADPFTGQLSMHAGLDFAAPQGTPILAAAGGVVTSAEYHSAFGNSVTIEHGNGLSTLYAHASKLNVNLGDIVRRGEKIAEVGTTGRSTGPHLHFEVHKNRVPQNPKIFLDQFKHVASSTLPPSQLNR